MLATYQQHFLMLLRAQAFCVKYNIPLSLLQEYPQLIVAFNLILNKIQAAKSINETDITHFATNKEILQKVMFDLVYKYQRRARVFARNIPDNNLYASLKHPISYISNNADDVVADKSEEIKNIMKNNLLKLLNIENSMILEMEAAITAYRAELLSPKIAIEARKSLGTDPIPDLLKEADLYKIDIDDLVHSYLPDNAQEWDDTTIIGKPTGVRHQSAILHITDALTGVVLANATCTATNGIDTFVKKSSRSGWVRFYNLETDNYTFTLERKSNITVTLTNIGVDDIKLVKLEVKLQKIQPSTPPTE